MKVREPAARPLDVIGAELLLTVSQAFVVGVLLYLAVGVWDERGVGSGSIAAILVALAFAVGGAWLYWLLGGQGLPLAAAELPVALFLTFAALLGLRGEELVRVEPLALLLTLASSTYGIVAGVFLDSPRRLRWNQRRTSRRQERVPRVSATTAAWGVRARGLRRAGAASADTPRADASTTSRPTAGPGRAPESSPEPVEEPPRPPAAPESAPTVTAPDVPAKPVAPAPPTRGRGSGGRSSSRGGASPTSAGSGPVELPTSVEPRAQRSPWAWAKPPEWNRDDDAFEDEHHGDRT